MNKKHLYITVYTTEQVYGGPEEGGWWYDWTEVDNYMLLGKDKRRKLRRVMLQAQEYADSLPYRYCAEVVVEHDLGSLASKERPYYC